ncbi:hypothetical protein SCYAM73S_06854 [Streptomyces cyaneofuscatus]
MPRLGAEVTGTVVLVALASLTAGPEAALPDGVADRVDVAGDTVVVRWAEDGAPDAYRLGQGAGAEAVTVDHG